MLVIPRRPKIIPNSKLGFRLSVTTRWSHLNNGVWNIVWFWTNISVKQCHFIDLRHQYNLDTLSRMRIWKRWYCINTFLWRICVYVVGFYTIWQRPKKDQRQMKQVLLKKSGFFKFVNRYYKSTILYSWKKFINKILNIVWHSRRK